jgi:hypothetical protein
MRIITNGNVGINITSPYGKLDVGGSIALNGRPVIDNSSTELYIGGITGVSGRGIDIISLWTGNTERMRITSTGNVGIGTSSPSNPLYVVGSMKSETGLYFNNTGANGAFVWQEANTPLRFATNDTERMRIQSNGIINLGSTTDYLQIANDSIGTWIENSNATSSKRRIRIQSLSSSGANYTTLRVDGTNSQITFETGDVERGRFASSGYFKACNFASPSYSNNYHQIYNNIYGDWIAEVAHFNTVPYGLLLTYRNASPRNAGQEMMYLNDSTGNVFKISSNGNCYNLNNVYTSLSDIKLKENITDATPKLEKLMQVKIRNYNLKTDPDLKQIGVIAQELQEVFPGLIEENFDRDADNNLNGETTLGVKYSIFVPILIKALQEANTKIEELSDKVSALENKS